MVRGSGNYDAERLRLTNEQRDAVSPEWVAMAELLANVLAHELNVDLDDCLCEIWELTVRWARTEPQQFQRDAQMSWKLLKRMAAIEILESVRCNPTSGIRIPRKFVESGTCGDPIAAERAAGATRGSLWLGEEGEGDERYGVEVPDTSWVSEMLERLPEGPRRLVRLRMAGYSDVEIKGRLGVSEALFERWLGWAGRIVADALAIEARTEPGYGWISDEIMEDAIEPPPASKRLRRL